jgi:hypothetical protein
LCCFTDRTNPTVECPVDQSKTGISRFTSFTGLKAKGKYSEDVTNKSYSIHTGMLYIALVCSLRLTKSKEILKQMENPAKPI